MNIQEMINMVRANSNVRLAKIIETKVYLPFYEKVDLVHSIIEKCTSNNDGFVQVNEIDQYMHFTVETIKAYTNIEFGENYVYDYDLLCSSGLLGDVIATFDGEYKMILNMVEMEKKYVLEQNKIEFQVAKVADALVDAIEQFGSTVSNKVDSLDNLITPENIDMIRAFMTNIK